MPLDEQRSHTCAQRTTSAVRRRCAGAVSDGARRAFHDDEGAEHRGRQGVGTGCLPRRTAPTYQWAPYTPAEIARGGVRRCAHKCPRTNRVSSQRRPLCCAMLTYIPIGRAARCGLGRAQSERRPTTPRTGAPYRRVFWTTDTMSTHLMPYRQRRRTCRIRRDTGRTAWTRPFRRAVYSLRKARAAQRTSRVGICYTGGDGMPPPLCVALSLISLVSALLFATSFFATVVSQYPELRSTLDNRASVCSRNSSGARYDATLGDAAGTGTSIENVKGTPVVVNDRWTGE